MTNISGAPSPIHPISLCQVEGIKRELLSMEEEEEECLTKSLSRRDGQHPRLELRFLVIPAHRQQQRRQRAQFIFWFVMRGGGQQSRPCYATCSPSAEVGAGAGTPPLTFSIRAGCAARLRCPIRQLRKWAVGRACHLIHHLAQLAGVMEAGSSSSSSEYLEAALWQAAAAAAGRPAAATRRPWQGHGHTGGLEGGGCT